MPKTDFGIFVDFQPGWNLNSQKPARSCVCVRELKIGTSECTWGYRNKQRQGVCLPVFAATFVLLLLYVFLSGRDLHFMFSFLCQEVKFVDNCVLG